ncbi:VOC family protein [Enterococcus rivorum]|uniref:VOC domain-containing protein n=1 Tax=Enterococcus rivorum TaxID=762845 RepID=A0A1E5KTZ4_9ENTE|nr:VOC family protein [Enterococcus rivorum]MBP2097919.1 catechol 2,3-dioxygenase [Enterococcus rivorum]OEH81228.1 hypothetical protein BCR26_05105 [Enterococcus rivorum]
MEVFQMSKEVTLETIALRMKKAESMIKFYKNILGFILKNEENNLSIFGTKEIGSQLLILEDVSYKVVEVAEEKKLARFTLLIPTEDEFISVLKRLEAFHYPINKASENKYEQSLLLEDPDGNEIEILHKSSFVLCDEERVLDQQKLLKKSTINHKILSPEVKFSKLYLNVESVSEMSLFYQKILGMSVEGEDQRQLSIDNANLSVYLQESKFNQSVETAEDRLGVDFFISYLEDKEAMINLKKHLENKKMDFFIDKKMKILTIFDPSGIEWWFIRK